MHIKPLADIASKFVNRASSASQFYKTGVQQSTSWQSNAAAANDTWKQGVNEAAAADRFGKGVNKAGQAKWQNKAATKGAANYGSGVAASQQDYSDGFAPFRSVIEGLTLAPRGAKGSPQNYDRVRAVGEALHQAKLQG